MELYINSPSYYTQEYGVEDDIYWMCRKLSEWVKGKKYSDEINIIGIVPIVASDLVIKSGCFKEYKRCELTSGLASVSMQIDYEEYVKADIDNKKRLIIDNILKSVKSISKRGKINYSLFENDIREFCETNNIII